MNKYLIICLLLISHFSFSQSLPGGFPTQFNTGWQQWGYQQSLSGTIIATRDTLWVPRFCGTIVLWPHASVDTAFWMWDCIHWKKMASTSDISGATNNVNLGSGFRILNATTQTMRTIFAGFGTKIDSIANVNGLTWRADTTRVTGLPTYYYVDSSVNATSITANNGLTKTGSNVQLGGTLIQTTSINNGSNLFSMTGTNTSETFSLSNTSTGKGILVSAIDNNAVDASSTNASAVSAVSTNGEAISATSTNNAAGQFSVNPSNTNSIIDNVLLTRATTGTAANGEGQAIVFYNQLASGSALIANRIVSKQTNVVDANRTSALEFYGTNNNVYGLKASLSGSGQWNWPGYPSLTAQTDSTTYKPLGYDGSGNIVPMANWIGVGGTAFTSGNGISLSNNKISQLYIPFKTGTIIIGDSYSKGCCPDGTYTTWQDTLATSFLAAPSLNNLSISGIGVRKGCYQLFNNFGESHANYPIGMFVGFNNTRIQAVDTALHYETIRCAYRSMIASQFLTHIEAPQWGASGTNSNVTFSNGPAPASSEDTLLNWQSRLYYFRHNSVNTGANWFNKAFCSNDTITIASMIGSNLAFGTFAYYNSAGSRIKINVDGTDIITYNPNNRTYTGQAEGFTPDGIIPDAISILGLSNVSHIVKVIFLDNGKRGALDWFGSMCSAQESYDRPAYILSFPHMTDSGYNYAGGQTSQAILDSATAALKGNLQLTYPNYAMAFVNINYPTGFYNPNDFGEVSADSIHPTSRGQYNIGKSVYTLMLKSDRGSVNTLDGILANGNTSARQMILTNSNSTAPNLVVGSDLIQQVFAPSNSWISSNLYYDGSNFKYYHNGVASQQYFNSGYIEYKTAPSGTLGATATVSTRMTISPTGDTWLGGNIVNSFTGSGGKLLVNGTSGNVTIPSVASIGPTSYTLGLPIMMYAIGSQPGLAFYNAGGATNQKVSDITLGSNTIDFRLANDAYSSANDWMTVTRTGYTNAQVYFPLGEINIGSGTDQGSFTLQNTGGLYQNGAISLNTLTAPPSTYNILVHGLTDSVVYQVPLSSLSGITSINSQTGPSITMAATNGLSVANTTNTVTYSLGGTLTGTTTINGASNSLNIGASGNTLSSLSVWSGGRINLFGQTLYGVDVYSADADHTMAANVTYEELSANSLTADRTLTLPTAIANGQTIKVITLYDNVSTHHYNLSSAVTDNATGTTFTQLAWGKTYTFYVDASIGGWRLIDKY